MPNNKNQQDEYYWYVRRNFNNDKVGTLAEFYCQPFKPEMITELFEGWTLEYDGYYVANSAKFVIEFCTEDGGEFHFYMYDYMKSEQILILGQTDILPRTLDDFINDATRAGIELEWKK